MKSNVDVVKELYRSFREKDYEAFKMICDENIVWRQNQGFPNGGHYTGAEEVIRHVFMAFDDSWESWRFVIDSYRDAGDAVIVTGRYEGKHQQTGKKFVSEAAHIYELNKGKVISFQQYADTKPIWDAMT